MLSKVINIGKEQLIHIPKSLRIETEYVEVILVDQGYVITPISKDEIKERGLDTTND